MSSDWDDAWTTASADIDDRFGSLFLYRPMALALGGGRDIPDPNRAAPSQPITGALDERRELVYPAARHKAQSTVQQQSTHDGTIDIALSALPWLPQERDLLIQCDENSVPIGATFRVAVPETDCIARVVLYVIKLKTAP